MSREIMRTLSGGTAFGKDLLVRRINPAAPEIVD